MKSQLSKLKLALAVTTCIAALSISSTPVMAQTAPQWQSYAAKFVCGESDSSVKRVVQGRYSTVINIHNPHYLWADPGGPDFGFNPVIFYKKAVLASLQGEPVIRPSCKVEEALKPDHALAVDCEKIRELLLLTGLPMSAHIEGFLVIEVPPVQVSDNVFAAPKLDVSSVYSAKHRWPGAAADVDWAKHDVSAMDVEQIEPTNILGGPPPVDIQDLCN